MKRLMIACLVACTFSFPAFAQQKGGPDFKGLVKEYYAAWNTLNLDTAGRLYAKDADLVFFDIAPLKYKSWAEYRDNFKNNVAPGFSSLTLTPNNDVKVTRSGNLALTTLTFHFSAKQKDGTPMEFDARHTIVWQKRGARWLIIHEHVSKPLF